MVPREQFRILVVDDEAPLRRALRTSLKASGFSVEEASSAGEASEAIREQTFDLALLDINMPGVSGLELCRQMRDLGQQIGILMVTVRDTEKDVLHALEAGADDYIVKPFRLGELTARCRAVLRRIHVPNAAEESPIRVGDLELDLGRRMLR
jgi:two-component system, OmpR family, KDP operon response regulator KdpE